MGMDIMMISELRKMEAKDRISIYDGGISEIREEIGATGVEDQQEFIEY